MPHSCLFCKRAITSRGFYPEQFGIRANRLRRGASVLRYHPANLKVVCLSCGVGHEHARKVTNMLTLACLGVLSLFYVMTQGFNLPTLPLSYLQQGAASVADFAQDTAHGTPNVMTIYRQADLAVPRP